MQINRDIVAAVIFLSIMITSTWSFNIKSRNKKTASGLTALVTANKTMPTIRETIPITSNKTDYDDCESIRNHERDKNINHQLKFGSFNIQTLGITKLNKPDIMAAVFRILSRYDIVLIQEIRMSDELFKVLMTKLNQFSM